MQNKIKVGDKVMLVHEGNRVTTVAAHDICGYWCKGSPVPYYESQLKLLEGYSKLDELRHLALTNPHIHMSLHAYDHEKVGYTEMLEVLVIGLTKTNNEINERIIKLYREVPFPLIITNKD